MDRRSLRRTTFLHLLVIVATLIAGTALFCLIEGWSLEESFYYVVLLMTLIGASGTPGTVAGTVLAAVLAVVSVGIILSFFTQVLAPISLEFYWTGWKIRKVSHMENHVVVCGYSNTAKALLDRIPKEQLLFVVRDSAIAKELADRGIAVVEGDYETAEVLRRAGVARCRAVIALSMEDSDNAFVCLTAKKLAPSVPVIATVSSDENREKLDDVGADHIVAPALLSAAAILQALGTPNAAPR